MVLFSLFTKLLKNSAEKENLKHAALGFVSAAVPQIIMAWLQDF